MKKEVVLKGNKKEEINSKLEHKKKPQPTKSLRKVNVNTKIQNKRTDIIMIIIIAGLMVVITIAGLFYSDENLGDLRGELSSLFGKDKEEKSVSDLIINEIVDEEDISTNISITNEQVAPIGGGSSGGSYSSGGGGGGGGSGGSGGSGSGGDGDGGGNGEGDEACVPSLTCANYPEQCGISLFDGCSNSLECLDNCPIGLPLVFIDTTYNLPTGGTTYNVNAGDDLQAAIDNASQGDVLVLEAGATFTGNFILPNKTGNDWIYIISSELDNLPEGVRVSPGDAIHMPKIVSSNSRPAIKTLFGSHNYRFSGIEVSVKSVNYNLILLGFNITGRANVIGELPNYITFDRMYIHSTSDINWARTGILADGINISVIDSYISNFKDRSDSQAIISWQGTGPIKIVNNFLEATGENIMFGGAGVPIENAVPSDIEIRGNYFHKRNEWDQNLFLLWNASSGMFEEPPPSWGGAPLKNKLVQARWDPNYQFIYRDWTIKNLFELKNSRRVLVSGNIFEHSWGDAQRRAIVFTVRNQNNDANWSVVNDITFVNNQIKNSHGGFLISGEDSSPRQSQQTKRIIIRNNLIEDIEKTFFTLNTPNRPIENLTINHNTMIHKTENVGLIALFEGDGPDPPYDVANLTWNDNIIGNGEFGIHKTNGGDALEERVNGYEYVNNTIYGNVRNDPRPFNYHPENITAVGFINHTNGEYRLSNSSIYKNAATDGTDIGVNFDILNAALIYTLSGDPSQPQHPGEAQFIDNDNIIFTTEGVINVSIAVKRLVGFSGEVTVDYSTKNGTAVSGQDYIAISGTLTWADGDRDPKIIFIQIVDDSIRENDESFNITLSNPTNGLSIVAPDTAIINIFDDEIDINFGLKGYWKLDDGNGIITIDSSVEGNNGTLNGFVCTTLDCDPNSGWVSAGRIGNAVSFDGIDDYIDVGNDVSLETGLPISVSAWIYHNGSDTFRAIFGTKGTEGNRYAGILLQIENDDNIGLHFGNDLGTSTSARRSLSGTTAIPVNTWTHVVGVIVDSNNMAIYINGVNDGGTFSGSATTMVYASNSHLINTDGIMWGSQEEFDGSIDDVRLYDRVLNEGEIALLASGVILSPPDVEEIQEPVNLFSKIIRFFKNLFKLV